MLAVYMSLVAMVGLKTVPDHLREVDVGVT